MRLEDLFLPIDSDDYLIAPTLVAWERRADAFFFALSLNLSVELVVVDVTLKRRLLKKFIDLNKWHAVQVGNGDDGIANQFHCQKILLRQTLMRINLLPLGTVQEDLVSCAFGNAARTQDKATVRDAKRIRLWVFRRLQQAQRQIPSERTGKKHFPSKADRVTLARNEHPNHKSGS